MIVRALFLIEKENTHKTEAIVQPHLSQFTRKFTKG